MANLLIVDDDEAQRLLFQSLLDGLGHELFFAADGEAALQSYKTHSIHLVITDLAMPRVNGLRLIKEIREENPRARIIAISGVAKDQLLLAEDYGATAVLTKPVDRDEFLAAFEEAMEPEARRGTSLEDGWWDPRPPT